MRTNIITIFVLIFLSSCKTKSSLDFSKYEIGNSLKSKTNVQKKRIKIAPNSNLLGNVGKDLQDTLIQKYRMEFANHKHIKNSGQLINEDVPAIDLSSLEFIPVVSAYSKPGGSIPEINKKRIFASGKTNGGDKIYILGYYTDWASIADRNIKSGLYKERIKLEGSEKINARIKELYNRKGLDNWRLIFFKEGNLLFDLAEFARKEAENSNFFILTKSDHSYDFCYFKGGKLLNCKRPNKAATIRTYEL